MMNERCARAMLGVSPSATTGQIKRAYRRLALDLHPDRGGDPAGFQQLVVARELLLAARSAPSPWLTVTTSPQREPRRPAPSARARTNQQTAKTPPVRFGDVLAEKLAAA